MSTVNCLCQIERYTDKYGNIHPSWLRVTRKRLGDNNAIVSMPREDVISVYSPVLIGICKAYFKNEINEQVQYVNTNSKNNANANKIINPRDHNIALVRVNYHGMETEQYNGESRVMHCGRWIVWNNRNKCFNHPIDYKGYWILKFPKDYWDAI